MLEEKSFISFWKLPVGEGWGTDLACSYLSSPWAQPCLQTAAGCLGRGESLGQDETQEADGPFLLLPTSSANMIFTSQTLLWLWLVDCVSCNQRVLRLLSTLLATYFLPTQGCYQWCHNLLQLPSGTSGVEWIQLGEGERPWKSLVKPNGKSGRQGNINTWASAWHCVGCSWSWGLEIGK